MKNLVLSLIFDVILCGFDNEANGLHMPYYIKNCKVREPSFKGCALKSAREAITYIVKGDRQYNFPSFTPLILPFVRLSTIGLDFNATSIKATGLDNVKLIDISVKLEELSVFFKLSFPMINLNFDYSVSGKIVSLPMEGHGPGIISLKSTIIQYTLHTDVIEKNGKRFLKIAKEEMEVNPEGEMNFNFSNLFNGDKTLGENLNNFLTEKWKDVLAEVGSSVAEVVGTKIKRIMSSILEKIPIEQILPGF